MCGWMVFTHLSIMSVRSRSKGAISVRLFMRMKSKNGISGHRAMFTLATAHRGQQMLACQHGRAQHVHACLAWQPCLPAFLPGSLAFLLVTGGTLLLHYSYQRRSPYLNTPATPPTCAKHGQAAVQPGNFLHSLVQLPPLVWLAKQDLLTIRR